MTLTVTCKRHPEESGSSDANQQTSYKSVYKIQQTDTGSRGSAYDLITAAQALMSGDILPVYGDNFVDAGTTDLDAYAQTFTWSMTHGANHEKILQVEVGFAPASGSDPGRLSEPDPLLWPTEYWVEWTEEQVVLREARNVDDLTFILRSANTLGPVVNSCGVDFTDPPMKTIYYPVLHCQKFYETLDEIIALNTSFQNTTNNATFFGSDQRTAKYLGTESGRIQKLNGTSCYAGITRIWFKKETWDRKILNNGWTHFEYNSPGVSIRYKQDGTTPKQFQNLAYDTKQATAAEEADDDSTTPASEPLNLTLDGTLLGPEAEAVYLAYRDLEEVNYAGLGIGG